MRRKGVNLVLASVIVMVILIVFAFVMVKLTGHGILKPGGETTQQGGGIVSDIGSEVSGLTVRIDKIEYDSQSNDCKVTVEVLDRKMKPKADVTIILYEVLSGGDLNEIDNCNTGINGKCSVHVQNTGNYSIGTESEQKLFWIKKIDPNAQNNKCEYELLY